MEVVGGDDRSFGRPPREEGAEVAGWSGPGRGRVRARDVADIRDATYGGLRSPARRVRRAAVGASPGVQFLLAVTAIVGVFAVLGIAGALSGVGNDGTATIRDAISQETCAVEDDGILVYVWADTRTITDQVELSEVDHFRLEVTIFDGDVAVADQTAIRTWSFDRGRERLPSRMVVPLDSTPTALSCGVRLVAVGR